MHRPIAPLEISGSKKSKRRLTSSSGSRAALCPIARRAMAIQARIATEERDVQPRDHFAAEMDHMSECVMNDKTPLTPGEEGLQDLKIMTAIYQAAREGKTV